MIPPRKILIIRLSSLGDIIHALPACQSLRSSFPAARLDWLVEANHEFLLSSVDFLDYVIPMDTKSLSADPWEKEGWRRAWRALGELRSTGYDVCLDFQGLLKPAFFSYVSGAAKRVGFPPSLVRERPAHWFYNHVAEDPGVQLHVTRLNLLLVESIGGDGSPPLVDFKIENEAERAIETQLVGSDQARLVVINPGGGWHTKRWSSAKYGTLAAKIVKELGASVIVTTGPGEEHLYQEMARHTEGTLRHLQLPFLHLIPLLRRTHLFIGGDTGPFHLACALGTRVVGIFGPTSPTRNGPWPNPDGVVQHVLPCSYCYGRSCPTKNECMDISVLEVFEKVRQRIEDEA
jgi:lipopolysaccharide heptosyltransferase I